MYLNTILSKIDTSTNNKVHVLVGQQKKKENRLIVSEILSEVDSVEITKDYLKGKGFDLSIFNRMLMIDQVQAYGIYEYYLKPVDSVSVEIGKIR